jgi:hypothetical protein
MTGDLFRQILREEARQQAYPPEVHFLQRHVSPPPAAYFGPDDELQTTVFTTATTTGLQLALRYFDPTGRLQYQLESLDGASLSTVTTKVWTLPEGFMLGVAVTNLGGGLADGVCWVSIGLQESLQANRPAHTILAQGYVTNLYGVEWPTPPVRAVPGSGGTQIPISQSIANPAAGADWVFTVPAAKQYILKSAYFTLVTSATVATRSVLLVIDDGANRLFRGDTNATQAASLTQIYSAGSGTIGQTAAIQTNTIGLPTDMPLAAGWRVGTQTLNIQAADQFTGIRLGLLQFS